MKAYLIFVAGRQARPVEKKSVMWRNFKILYMKHVEKVARFFLGVRVFYFFDAIFPVLVFWISPSVPTLQTPAQVLSGGWRTEILTLCTVGFHNSYFGKTSLESARLKSQYQIISDFTQNRRQQQILSKTHKYFLFDFFATNADYFSFSQTQTKEILTSFDVFGLREASA